MKQLIVLALTAVVVLCYESFEEIYGWKSIDFKWPSDEERQNAINWGDYIPENNFISTGKVWKDKLYLALPRRKDGVPITLAVTWAMPINNMTAPLLEPFPDWNMQKLGNCSAFQLVQSMEIDLKGRMWVLDTGRPLTIFKVDCPARLVILDLENGGEILRNYEFPDDVARQGDTFLNDIVVDHEDGGMAYITDSGLNDPGIIVYSLKNNTSWKIRHETMKVQKEAVKFKVAETEVNEPVSVDGIALSPASEQNRRVYYCPLSSFYLYSVPVFALKDNMTDIDQYVKNHGRKDSQTDGMVMAANGVLYFGLLADDAIAMWDTKNTFFSIGQRVISRDHVIMQWPDSCSIDENGNLLCVTNMLQNFVNNKINPNITKYRFIRLHVGVKNYQNFENGMAPKMPGLMPLYSEPEDPKNWLQLTTDWFSNIA